MVWVYPESGRTDEQLGASYFYAGENEGFRLILDMMSNSGSRPPALERCSICLGFLLFFLMVCFSSADLVENVDLSELEVRVLKPGIERRHDRLPLRGGGGKCLYEIVDLKVFFSYEVKVSYPATVPSLFSLKVVKTELASNVLARKLLNTEKVIFTASEGNSLRVDELRANALVLVTVEPEGILSQADTEEHEFVEFNVLLEEVWLGGIPQQALWVGFLVVVAVLASVIAAQSIVFRADRKAHKHAVS